MKRRETKSGREDAGRSALVRAGTRWLSFARTLSRGRRRLAVADTLDFIETLYGGKYTAVEESAFSLDKVYRTIGGGLFVSETRLSISVHPRFDLRLPNVAGGREQHLAARHSTNVDSRSFRSNPTTLYQTISSVTLTLLQQRTHFGGSQTTRLLHTASAHSTTAPSLTAHTWNVLPASSERLLPAFGYVSVRSQRAQQPQGPEPARPPDASMPASLRFTSIDLRRPDVHAPQQEFVSVLLKTYLPAVESRESLSMRTTGALSGAPPKRATSQREAERHFTTAAGMLKRQPSAWTYASPTTRQQPGGAVEIRSEFREFRSAETVKEQASSRDPRHPMLQVMPPTSLLLSLSEEFLTMLAGVTGVSERTPYELGGRAPVLSLQHLRTRTAPSGTREGSVAVHGQRRMEQTPQHQTPRRPTDTRKVLSSVHTFVERAHSTHTGLTRAGYSTVITRHGFEQVSARPRGASSETAPGDRTSRGLVGRAVELVRPSSFNEFRREALTRAARTQIPHDRATGFFSTQGATGTGTFLFSTGLLRRSAVGSTTVASSPTVATALRFAAAEETARASSEARSARPEGMALELIRHRREDVLNLPQPGYVFTQPARAQLEERQVITKASREEIVEVVRKEVRSLAAAAPAPLAASRADLAGLADEVYSTLVRRLLVEKERLGR